MMSGSETEEEEEAVSSRSELGISELSSSISILSDNIFDQTAIARFSDREVDSTEIGVHRLTIAVTVSLSVATVPLRQASAKVAKGKKSKSNAKQSKVQEIPKAQRFLHCEYELLPGDESPVRTDLVVYEGVAKIYAEQQEPKAVKTWTNGCATWITWTNCHQVTVTDSLLRLLTSHQIILRIWEGKEKVSSKARFDRPKGFKTLKSEDGEINVTASLIKQQCENYLYFRPKRFNINPFACESKGLLPSCPPQKLGDVSTKALTKKSKGARKVPSATKNLKVPTASGMESPRPRSPDAERKVKSKANSGKDGNQSLSKEDLLKLKQKKNEIDKNGLCSIRLPYSRLYAGFMSLTERLIGPVDPVLDAFITLSLDKPLLSSEQVKIFNPLMIEVRSAINLPSEPLSYEDLRKKCKPAYIKYRIFDCEERCSKGLPQERYLFWDDVNIILAGLMDEGVLREYLSGTRLEIEVHDRDRIIKIPEDKGALFGECIDDEKIGDVGMITSQRTTQNAFKKYERPWDPYGVSRIDLSELLLGQTVLFAEEPICNSPCPDVLGLQNPQNGLVGCTGAVDGPVDSPIETSDYLYSDSHLKVRVRLAHPLTTPKELASHVIKGMAKCPFARVVFKFEHKNTSFLQRLHSLVIETNIDALGLSNLPDHVRYTALATFTLSEDQIESTTLDVISGFKVSDGEIHLYVLEGLRHGAMKQLISTIMEVELPPDVHVLYHSNLGFQRRLYASLGPDLHCIKLHEPLSVIMKQQKLFIRDLVPSLAFQGLYKIHSLCQVDQLRIAVKNDLFPSAASVVSTSKEFGVPVTPHQFKVVEIESDDGGVTDCPIMVEEDIKTSAELPENYAEIYSHIGNANNIGSKRANQNWSRNNKDYVFRLSEISKLEKIRSQPETIQADVEFGHNYGNQKLNSVELAKEKLRRLIAKEKDGTYTYCREFHHSSTVSPVDLNQLSKERALKSRRLWLTDRGWMPPNTRSTIQKRAHPKKLDPAAVDELTIPFDEMFNLAEAAFITRLPYTWNKRKLDMDIWTNPSKFQATTTLPEKPNDLENYVGIETERRQVQQRLKDEWRSKVVVDDVRQHFHRCAIDTELQERGPKSANQIARLRGLLKDCPEKYSFKEPPMVLREIPALGVVNYPSVDVACQTKGRAVPLVCPGEELNCFNPGSFTTLRLSNPKNSIPAPNYDHKYFEETKGKDFTIYFREKKKLYTRPIPPQDEKERFRNSLQCSDWRLRLEEMDRIRQWNNFVTRSLVENRLHCD